MIDKELQLKIHRAISNGESDGTMYKILRDFKMSGGKQLDARDTLHDMRRRSTENYEDRVLEVMDIMSGFCEPKYRVW